ncbi:MAG: sigma-70 family RNA polymerase sigma factor [Alkalinema sp. RU_4_3]|nr:sigma-70 family RNA polymerase sigma factor [Alkalinema sp. RU_4_3]
MQSQPHHPQTPLFKTFLDRKIAPQIARKQTRNTHIPWEDALQTAYTKLWQATLQNRFHSGTPDDYCRWAARVCAFAIMDYLQHSQQRPHYSLDQPLPGTDIPLVETLTDEFDSLDAIDRADLLSAILDILAELDRKRDKPIYLLIWQSLLLGKTQKQIAQELNLRPTCICRHWQEIKNAVAKLYPNYRNSPDRRRTEDLW